MKKVICKVTYDTDASKEVKKVTVGAFCEQVGFEEVLYQTEEGKYFLYVNGGTSSKYPKEDLKRLSKEKAENWLKEHA
ncbi:MAG: hypothetical protein KHW87_08945 [Clostridiales bacterium]|nr:hypothetical protein [Clostridiales bacterium]